MNPAPPQPVPLRKPSLPPRQDCPRRLRGILSLDDFERAARGCLPRPIFGFVAGAVEDNRTLRNNRSAFDRYDFVPRVLVDVGTRSPATTLFGRRYAAPFGIAPMGLMALSAYRGDVVLAEAAQAAGVPSIMSASSLIRLEEVMAAAPDTWFQAYLPGDPDAIDPMLDRIRRAGVEILVLTVDAGIAANRENNIRSGFSTPLRPSLRLAWDGLVRPRLLASTLLRTLARHGMPHFENNAAGRGVPVISPNVMRDFSDRSRLDWQDVARVRRRWQGPLLIKGIMSPADAALARAHGADGIVVSNHGGRQLDGTAAPLQALPRIAEAVGALPVMMDSGVRRGTDVLKALALGACCVFAGRPFNFAAAVAGRAGVDRAIGLLYEEVLRDMGMLGIRDIREMDAGLLAPGGGLVPQAAAPAAAFAAQ